MDSIIFVPLFFIMVGTMTLASAVWTLCSHAARIADALDRAYPKDGD